MTGHSIVGIAGSICGDGKILAVVEALVGAAGAEFGAAIGLVDYCPLNAAVRTARFRSELDADARTALATIEAADALVIGFPFERGSIPGAFKHLFDLADPGALAGTPVLAVSRRPAEATQALAERQLDLFCETFGLERMDGSFLVDPDDVDRAGGIAPALQARIVEAARRMRLAQALKDGPVWRVPATGEPLLFSR